MHKIKLIMRKARISYQILFPEGHIPEWRVCIAIEAARFFRRKPEEGVGKSALVGFIEKNSISASSIFGKFLYLLSEEGANKHLITMRGNEEVVAGNAPKPWMFRERHKNDAPRIDASRPFFLKHAIDNTSGIVLDFYLRH
ncbi:MAG: hypothetical protein ACI9AR_000446 [Flavobacteriaceae bacterium]|jgi:hypothetical protein